MVIPLGGLVTIALLLPNFVWILYPTVDQKENPTEIKSRSIRVLEIMEQIGRMAVFIIPFFYTFNFTGALKLVFFMLMILMLGFYYVGWIRYFRKGRNFQLLYLDLIKIPIPLAIFPILFLFFASIVLVSWPLAISAVFFGTAHIALSWQERKKLLFSN